MNADRQLQIANPSQLVFEARHIGALLTGSFTPIGAFLAECLLQDQSNGNFDECGEAVNCPGDTQPWAES